MQTTRFRSCLSLALAAALTLAVCVSPVAASGSGAVGGRVFQADGVTPRSGVVVALYDGQADATYRSGPTGEDGAFRVESAPAGSYTVLAQTSEGAFLAAEGLELAAGENRPVALALNATAPGYAAAAGGGSGGARGTLPAWAKGLIAGSISLAALFVINEIVEDTEEPASSF